MTPEHRAWFEGTFRPLLAQTMKAMAPLFRQGAALEKRARIAARLAEVQKRSLYRFDFLCTGCMDPQFTAPIYSDWECGGDCYYRGRVRP